MSWMQRHFRYGARVVQRSPMQAVKQRVSRLEKGYGKELKTFDTATVTAPPAAGLITPLSQMAQGDTSITREGLQISPSHLLWKYDIQLHTTPRNSIARVIIFCDKQMAGTDPTVAQVLESADVQSWPEHDTRPRFKIYRDIVIPMDTSSKLTRFQKGIIKFGKGFKIWYSGTTGAEASSAKNQLYVLTLSNEATNVPPFEFRGRLRFTDG